MYVCDTCGEHFYERSDLYDHIDDDECSSAECETCDKTFKTQRACNQHMNDTSHWAPTYECEACDKTFRTEHARDQHMAAMGHWPHYCKSCERRFENENNLKMHLNSKIHRGSNIICPFCKVGHTTASGLCHHLETGSCPNARGLNHDSITRIIRERDPNGVIINKQLTYHGTSTYSATNHSWNGRAWECYICHRTFRTVTALNQHLNSPTHRQKVYHCPNRGCSKDFVSLAALFSHLESESCSFMRFETVQKHVGQVLTGNRLIAFS